MVAAGALTGEAFFGVEAAVMAVTDELETEQVPARFVDRGHIFG